MALSARSVLIDRVSRVVTIHLLCQSVPLPLGLLKFPSYPDALLMLGSVQAGEGMLVLGDHVVWLALHWAVDQHQCGSRLH